MPRPSRSPDEAGYSAKRTRRTVCDEPDVRQKIVVKVRKQDHHTVLDLLPVVWGCTEPALFIHADSHADLDIPSAFTRAVCDKVRSLPCGRDAARALVGGGRSAVCDISSWIMPLVALRVLGTVVFIRPAWQTDGGDEAAPDGSYDLKVGWAGDDLRVFAASPMPERIAWLWGDCGTWSEKPMPAVANFRLVLAHLPLPSLALPPAAEALVRAECRAAATLGAQVCFHVDLDVHSTFNPVQARVESAIGAERASALYDSISAVKPSDQAAVASLLEVVCPRKMEFARLAGPEGWESEEQAKAAQQLCKFVVAGNKAAAELMWLRANYRRLGTWQFVWQLLETWSLRWAPHHPSTKTEVEAVGATLRHIHSCLIEETQQLPLVTMCTSLGDFLPTSDLPLVEANLGWMDAWYVRQKAR